MGAGMKFFWNKKTAQVSPEASERAPVQPPGLDDARKLFQQKEFIQSLEAASQYLASQRKGIQHEANNLVALNHFKLGNHEQAAYLFAALAQERNDPADWFNLALSATLNDEIDKGRQAFEKAIALYKAEAGTEFLKIPSLTFYYMQSLKKMKRFDLAFEQLQVLGCIFAEAKLTEGHFLYAKALPLFQKVIGASREVLSQLDLDKVKAWLSNLRQSMDHRGHRYLLEFERSLNYAS